MELVNIIGVGKLSQNLILERIAFESDSIQVEYDPTVHQGAYIRFPEEESLITIYGSGKYIIRTSKEENLKSTENALLSFLEDYLEDIEVEEELEIQNMVFVSKVDSSLHLEKLAHKISHTEYMPEQFPGLVYRSSNHSATILAFESGKLVISGAKEIKEAELVRKEFIEQGSFLD